MDYQAGKVPSAVVLGTEGGPAWGFLTSKYCDLPQHQVYSLFKTPIGKVDYSARDDTAGNNEHGDEPEGSDHAGSRDDPDEGEDGDFQSDKNTMHFSKAELCLSAYLEGLCAHQEGVVERIAEKNRMAVNTHLVSFQLPNDMELCRG